VTGRIPPGDPAPSPDRSGAEPSPVERSMPIEHAVLWQPVAAPNESPDPGAYPVFVTRRALEALNHHAMPSGTSGVFGFIVGDLCHCPRTGILYVAVDGLIGLPQPVYGDKAGAVTSNVWPTLQQHLAKLKRHLLGWYHSHPPMGVMMAPGDVEAHLAFFPLPWQVALVVGRGEHGPEAGFFRPLAEAAAPNVPLHFFEILDPRALMGGAAPSCIGRTTKSVAGPRYTSTRTARRLTLRRWRRYRPQPRRLRHPPRRLHRHRTPACRTSQTSLRFTCLGSRRDGGTNPPPLGRAPPAARCGYPCSSGLPRRERSCSSGERSFGCARLPKRSFPPLPLLRGQNRCRRPRRPARLLRLRHARLRRRR
jgi:hypothetical protein